MAEVAPPGAPAWYKVSSLALSAEFFGTLLFSFFGGLPAAASAAYANGLALAVLVYIFAAVSGGHLNPGKREPCSGLSFYSLPNSTDSLSIRTAGVTLSTMISGHTAVVQGVCYMVAQCLGAIVGAAITMGLRPAGAGDVGCFGPVGISHGQLFGWEVIMAALLYSTVFAVAVSQKGAGNVGPGVIGVSLVAAALVGGPYTGAALNTARVLGPSVVFGCGWATFHIYLLAHGLAAVLSAGWALLVAPSGPYFVTRHRDQLGRLLSYTGFQRSTPWSTAHDPVRKHTHLVSNDASLPPYARGILLRRQALTNEEGLLPHDTDLIMRHQAGGVSEV